MGGLFDTLVCWLIWLLNSIPWAILGAINLAIKGVAALVNAAISLLPTFAPESPNLDQGFVGTANFFLPLGPLVIEAGLLITAWALYRAYRYLFKWFL